MSVPDLSVPDVPYVVMTPDSNRPPVTKNLMLPTTSKQFNGTSEEAINETLEAVFDRLKYKYDKLLSLPKTPITSMKEAQSVSSALRQTYSDIESLLGMLKDYAYVSRSCNSL